MTVQGMPIHKMRHEAKPTTPVTIQRIKTALGEIVTMKL